MVCRAAVHQQQSASTQRSGALLVRRCWSIGWVESGAFPSGSVDGGRCVEVCRRGIESSARRAEGTSSWPSCITWDERSIDRCSTRSALDPTDPVLESFTLVECFAAAALLCAELPQASSGNSRPGVSP